MHKVLEERVKFLETKMVSLTEEEKIALNEGLESLYNVMKQS